MTSRPTAALRGGGTVRAVGTATSTRLASSTVVAHIGALLLALALVGCLESDDTKATTTVASTSLVVITVPPRAPEVQALVDLCVDYVALKADLGDAMWSQLEKDMATDEAGLAAWCEQLATDDPAALARMREEYDSIQLFLAQAAAATTTSLP